MIAPLPNVNLADNETTEQPRRSIWGRQIIGSREACSLSMSLVQHTHTHTHSQRSQTNTAARTFYSLLFSSQNPALKWSMEGLSGERCWPWWLWLHSLCLRAEVNRQWTHTLCWRGLCSRVAQGRLEGRRVRSFSPGCCKTSRGADTLGTMFSSTPPSFALSHSFLFPTLLLSTFSLLCLSMTVCVCAVRIKTELSGRDMERLTPLGTENRILSIF